MANVNFNTPIKRHKLAKWIKIKRKQQQKHDPTMCCLQKTHFRFKDTNKLKLKNVKMMYQANNIQKIVQKVAIIKSGK